MKGWLAGKETLPGDLLTSIRKDWVRQHIHLLRFTMSISDDSLEYILGSFLGKVWKSDNYTTNNDIRLQLASG